MEMFAAAMINATRVTRREVTSALPQAPVVPHVERTPRGVPLRRTRAVTARGLERLARAVAPAPAPVPTCR